MQSVFVYASPMARTGPGWQRAAHGDEGAERGGQGFGAAWTMGLDYPLLHAGAEAQLPHFLALQPGYDKEKDHIHCAEELV